MSVTTRFAGLFFVACLTLSALSGCADVRQNPASNVVNGQASALAQQDLAVSTGPAAASTSPTNIPF